MTVRLASNHGPRATAREVVAGHDLSGRTIVVTGGGSGIGLETVRALAEAGADVTAAVRDPAAARLALADVRGKVTTAVLDLAQPNSVRSFTRQWGDRPIHVLINNAGVMLVPHQTDPAQPEAHIAINHLGHFLLTRSLARALQAGRARVVNVSSSAHRRAPFDFDDPHFRRRPFDLQTAYGQSKAANALFSIELDRRGKDVGVRSFALMPGVIRTPLMRHMADEDIAALEQRLRHVVKTPEQGAATSVWAAVGPELDGHGGLYLEDCAEAAPGADAAPGCGVEEHVQDIESAARLWRLSRELVGRQDEAEMPSWAV